MVIASTRFKRPHFPRSPRGKLLCCRRAAPRIGLLRRPCSGSSIVPKYGAGLSDIGRRRMSNEDAFLMDDDLGLYVVADGMGGHAAGEVASREAVDTVMG